MKSLARTAQVENQETTPQPTEALKPRDGEQLADWINRTRPSPAPAVHGSPIYLDGRFAWRMDGWTVEIEAADGGVEVHWQAPEGSLCLGYSLNDEGDREAAVVTTGGEATPLDGWPVAAVA